MITIFTILLLLFLLIYYNKRAYSQRQKYLYSLNVELKNIYCIPLNIFEYVSLYYI